MQSHSLLFHFKKNIKTMSTIISCLIPFTSIVSHVKVRLIQNQGFCKTRPGRLSACQHLRLLSGVVAGTLPV